MLASRMHRFAPLTRFALQAHARHFYAYSSPVYAQLYTYTHLHAHAPCRSSIAPCNTDAPWSRFAAISAAGVGFATGLVFAETNAYADVSGVCEPETGVHYPYTGPGGRTLAGTSARLVGGFMQICAVGLYVRANAVLMAAKAREVSDDQFLEAVCELAQPLLRLVIIRQVNGDHMATGFKRILMRTAKCKRPTPVMREFTALFKSLGTMNPDSEMLIECCGESGLVELTVDDRSVGSVIDKHLAKTLFSMYLAENAVTPKLRSDAKSGIQQILAG